MHSNWTSLLLLLLLGLSALAHEPNDVEFFYGRHWWHRQQRHHDFDDFFKPPPPSYGVPNPPEHPLQQYMPCVWTADQLVELAPREIWEGHDHATGYGGAPYQLCQMKLRYLELYDQRINHGPVGHWYNLSTEYLMFRLNRLLGHDFHYLTIPGPHDSVEHDITELLKLRCMHGYCNDYHVDLHDCGGELFATEFIYSNFYYVHLSMYDEGILRLQICNATVPLPSKEDEATWLDELLDRVAHEDKHEFVRHDRQSMHGIHTDMADFMVVIVAIIVLLILLFLSGMIMFCCRQQQHR
jgi:hypothetical protein